MYNNHSTKATEAVRRGYEALARKRARAERRAHWAVWALLLACAAVIGLARGYL